MQRRSVSNYYKRIIGHGDVVKGALNTIVKNVERKTRKSLGMWKKYSQDCRAGKILNALKSGKLKCALTKVPVRRLKDSFQRVFGAGDKVKGALKDIIKKIKKRQFFAFAKWKKFDENCKYGKVLDSLNTEKLRSALMRVPFRTFRKGIQIIMGSGDRTRGAVVVIVKQIEKKPKIALRRWEKAIVEIKQGLLFDACRTEKLRNALNKVPKRVTRDSVLRIIGNGAKTAAVLKTLKRTVERRPMDAIRKWKYYVVGCKSRRFLDRARSERAKTIMNSITKDSFLRIIGGGGKAVGALKIFVRNILKRPKFAMVKWKEYMCTSAKSVMFLNL